MENEEKKIDDELVLKFAEHCAHILLMHTDPDAPIEPEINAYLSTARKQLETFYSASVEEKNKSFKLAREYYENNNERCPEGNELLFIAIGHFNRMQYEKTSNNINNNVTTTKLNKLRQKKNKLEKEKGKLDQIENLINRDKDTKGRDE